MSAGFLPSAQVRPTTGIEVLEAVVAKIQSNVSILSSEPCCFISDTPEPSDEIQENLYATVCFLDGAFDQGMMDGSGNLGMVEDIPLCVTVFSQIDVDQIERYSEGMTDPERGLLTLKHQVLAALAGKNLDGGIFNGNSSALLLEPLFPRQSRHPQAKGDREHGSMGLVFTCKFWWQALADSEFV